MAANNRIFYAIQQVGIAEMNTTAFQFIHGVQSVGLTTTFNLEQVFELGYLPLYENIEDVPNIECTIEKVIDGWPLIYELASSGAPATTLVGRSTEQSMVAISVFSDTSDRASGDAHFQGTISGAFVNSLNYTFPVQGNCTEAVTLVANDLTWASGAACTFDGFFTDASHSDAPAAAQGVQRRENVNMIRSLWPLDIPGLGPSGVNIADSNNVFGNHIQDVSISTDLGREELFELGRRRSYYRFVSFPIEVTTAINVTTSYGHLVTAMADPPTGTNVVNRRIRICLDCGITFDLGTSNKLSSITQTGGDTGGGNVTVTYNYSNFNELDIHRAF